MSIYPIYEVNQGPNTILRGGMYDTATRSIDPASGNPPVTWDGVLQTNRTLEVVCETESGNEEYKLTPSVIYLNGTHVRISGS